MIFLTGGTGLIGSHLLLELCRKGKKVKALKRKSGNPEEVRRIFSFYEPCPESLFSTIEWVEGDLLDYPSLVKNLHEAEEIYHCAGMVSFRHSDRKKLITTNAEGTANLVNAALVNKVKRFCHVSSVSALGKTWNGNPVTEETSWISSKKNSGYSESKFYSEMEVWRGMEEGLPAVIVNPSVVIGPGNWQKSSPQLYTAIWKGLKFYTKGATGFVGVKDVVAAILTLMEPEMFARCMNQRFLLNSCNLKYREFFSRVAEALGKKPPAYFASDFLLRIAWILSLLVSPFSGSVPAMNREAVSGANRESLFDGSKISAETGFTYTDISEAISETARIFLKDHPEAGKKSGKRSFNP